VGTVSIYGCGGLMNGMSVVFVEEVVSHVNNRKIII
jgi:hypothetical protein